jgi:hypothetical protein
VNDDQLLAVVPVEANALPRVRLPDNQGQMVQPECAAFKEMATRDWPSTWRGKQREFGKGDCYAFHYGSFRTGKLHRFLLNVDGEASSSITLCAGILSQFCWVRCEQDNEWQ